MITNPTHTTNEYLAVQTSLVCNFPVTYTDTYVLAGSTITRPSFITLVTAAGPLLVMNVNSILKADIGIYTVTMTAEIP